MRTAVVCVGVLLLSSSLPARADKIDDFVRSHMHRQHIPGLSLAIVKDGKVVKAQGYGFASLEWKVPATPATVYSLHSVSKQFTAAGLMMLVEEGKVRLDDPVGRYLEESGEVWKGVTVRHLLSHTSGIPDHLAVDLAIPDDPTDADKVKALAALPLRFAPGERWSYNNSGYLLVAEIIRRVSGQNTTDFLRERLFRPLGMATATVISRTHPVPGRAPKYVWTDGEWRNAEFPYDVYQIADSGMAASALDLAKWATALSSGKVVSAESRAAMWTSGRLNDGSSTGYGFGWFVNDIRGQRRILHEGASFNGYRTLVCLYPDRGLAVILLTNGGQPNFSTLATGVAGLFDATLRPPFQMAPQADPDTERTRRLKALFSALAGGETPETGLTHGLRNALARGDRSRPPAAYKDIRSVAYLGRDDLRGKGFDRYGDPALEDVHLRIRTASGASFATFTLGPGGSLAGWRTYTADD